MTTAMYVDDGTPKKSSTVSTTSSQRQRTAESSVCSEPRAARKTPAASGVTTKPHGSTASSERSAERRPEKTAKKAEKNNATVNSHRRANSLKLTLDAYNKRPKKSSSSTLSSFSVSVRGPDREPPAPTTSSPSATDTSTHPDKRPRLTED